MGNRKFIRIFIAVFFTILFIIGLGNYMIDPYGMHFHSRYIGFNKHKPGFNRYTRLIKLFNADIIQPNGLFLGNSRILYLAPEKAFEQYKPYTFYNFSHSSGNVYEMNELLAYSIRNYDIEYVCYGIDYIAMNNWGGKYANGFDVELVQGKKSKLLEFIKHHTSIQAITESYECVNINMKDPEGLWVQYHYNPQGSRSNKWRELKLEILGENWIDEEIQNVINTYEQLYNRNNPYIPDYKKEAYRSILEQCKQNGIEYTAYINPLYKDQFKLLLISDSYTSYIDLLKFLAANGGFWYFGGINDITSNKEYFWDSQHPRKELSYLIAEALFTENELEYRNELYGSFYDNNNIERLIVLLDGIRSELLKGTE